MREREIKHKERHIQVFSLVSGQTFGSEPNTKQLAVNQRLERYCEFRVGQRWRTELEEDKDKLRSEWEWE